MAKKRYRVCCPRPFMKDGKERTYFWPVGTMFPLNDKDGFSIRLHTRVLPTDELVCFVEEPREVKPGATDATEPPGDDDLPF